MKATPLEVSARVLTCRYDGEERLVTVPVMSAESMLEALEQAACVAFGIDPASVIPGESKFLVGGGNIVVAVPAPGQRRTRVISELRENETVLFAPARRAVEKPLDIAAAEDSDYVAKHILQCCTTTLTTQAIRQPRFEYTFFREEEGDEAPVIPVCGPCAHTCHSMKHIHVMDPVKVLKRPFVCACASIQAAGHECHWAHDPCRGRVDAAVVADGVRRWDWERSAFIAGLAPHIEKETNLANTDGIEELTKRFKSSMDSCEQFSDPAAQAEARSVVPLAALNAKAEAAVDAHARANAVVSADSVIEGEEPLSIHDALLMELAHWFQDDFFSWVTRPDCEICGAPSVPVDDDHPEAVPTPEERLNWAFTIELYTCTACNAEVRFARYQRAQRLLTYRRGRCGEFALCFTLIATALGYDCRQVSSLSDQAWVEVYSVARKRWLHVDPSWGVVDNPLMYEAKAANQPPSKRKIHHYVMSYSVHQIVDVTRRYNSAPLTLVREKVSESSLARLLHGMSRVGMQRLSAEVLPFWEQRNREEARQLSLAERRGDISAFGVVSVVEDCDGDVNLIQFPDNTKCIVEVNDEPLDKSATSITFEASTIAHVWTAYRLGARLPVPARPTSSVTDVTRFEMEFKVSASGSDKKTPSWMTVEVGEAFKVRVGLSTSMLTFASATPLLNSQCTKVGGVAPIVGCSAPEAFIIEAGIPEKPSSSRVDVTVVIESTGAVCVSALFTWTAAPSTGAAAAATERRKGVRRGTIIPAHAWVPFARRYVSLRGAGSTLLALRVAWD